MIRISHYFVSLLLLVICGCNSYAQKPVYDIISYIAPAGFSKDDKGDKRIYTLTTKTSWCVVGIYKSIASRGSLLEDFTRDWKDLVQNPYGATLNAQAQVINLPAGWEAKTGGTVFKYQGQDAIVSLTTYTGYGKSISIVATTNSKEQVAAITGFLASVELKGDYNATTFSDGWTSTIQPDWVELTKGPVRVLIHYNNAVTQKYIPERREEEAAIWEHFITPRYKNVRGFEKLENSLSYKPVFFMAGNMTDVNGRPLFVALFRNGGHENWMEFICPDRATFIRTFGIDKYDINFGGWDSLSRYVHFNRFPVSPKDLHGTWRSDFTGMSQYVHIYTGVTSTGSYSSTQIYSFAGGNSYKWEIHSLSGTTGNMAKGGAAINGVFSVPDLWHLRVVPAGKPAKDLDMWFSAGKGVRVLWIDGVAYGKIK